MKIKFDIKELVKGQKKAQERCLELIGKGTFSIADLEKTIEELKNVNETLVANCNTTTMINSRTAGKGFAKVEVPTITQSKLYQDNQYLILALTTQINIAKVNNLEFVTDFKFTDDQILKYGQQKNIIR